jgi:hypothetical protein
MRTTLRVTGLKLLLALCALPIACPAFAWDRSGHRMACVKAWGELTEPSRAAVAEILGVGAEGQFADACASVDEILAERPETEAMHRIFIPKDARSIDLTRDCPKSCIVSEIEREAAIVVSDAPKSARAEALKVLAHLLADLHQPLNVAFADDRGGRDIKLTFLGRSTNLYALWESELLAAPDPPSHGYTPFLRQMTDRYNRIRWSDGTARDWAEETLWVMRAPPTGYVGNPGGLEFDALYVKQNYLIAVDQLDKAGIRLAFLLNGMFK